jgi:DNA-binding NarL/FixJ family response regulator
LRWRFPANDPYLVSHTQSSWMPKRFETAILNALTPPLPAAVVRRGIGRLFQAMNAE